MEILKAIIIIINAIMVAGLMIDIKKNKKNQYLNMIISAFIVANIIILAFNL